VDVLQWALDQDCFICKWTLPAAAAAGHTAILQIRLDECLSGRMHDQKLGWIHGIVIEAQDDNLVWHNSTHYTKRKIREWAKALACPGGSGCYDAPPQSCRCNCESFAAWAEGGRECYGDCECECECECKNCSQCQNNQWQHRHQCTWKTGTCRNGHNV